MSPLGTITTTHSLMYLPTRTSQNKPILSPNEAYPSSPSTNLLIQVISEWVSFGRDELQQFRKEKLSQLLSLVRWNEVVDQQSIENFMKSLSLQTLPTISKGMFSCVFQIDL